MNDDCTFKAEQTSPVISFSNVDGEPIGRLWVEDNKLVFEGDADEAAQVFFDHVLRRFNAGM